MIGGVIANSVNAAFANTETFETTNGVSPARGAVVSLITVLIIFALILLVSKYLWNNVLTALIPGVKPAKSVWQILGLAILISLLHPGCCSMSM